MLPDMGTGRQGAEQLIGKRSAEELRQIPGLSVESAPSCAISSSGPPPGGWRTAPGRVRLLDDIIRQLGGSMGVANRDIEGPFITLTCAAEGAFPVYFEPWGSECAINHGDILRVHSRGLLNGAGVEPGRVRAGIAANTLRRDNSSKCARRTLAPMAARLEAAERPA